MTICLPDPKRLALLESVTRLLAQGETSVRRLASLIGTLQAADPAIRVARLHFRYLQRLKISALKQAGGLYQAAVVLTDPAKAELTWWLEYLQIPRPIPIRQAAAAADVPTVIYTDSSLLMWGAFCEGEGVQGVWDDQERRLHINELELIAVQRALSHFASNLSDRTLTLQINNKSAICYLRKMGGTRSASLSRIATDIWDWLLQRNLDLSLCYIPSRENKAADLLSRQLVLQREWSLNDQVFRLLTAIWGRPVWDLFASAQNAKADLFFAWGHDPQSQGQNSLLDICQWQPAHLLYAYPPEKFIAKTIQKLIRSKVERLILIAPAWKTKPWYPLILEHLVDFPLSLPNQPDLILDQEGHPHPLLEAASLNLKAWLVSSVESDLKAFRSKLQNTCDSSGVEGLERPTRRIGEASVAGLLDGILIPFQPLRPK